LIEALSRKSHKSGKAIGMYVEALRAVDRDDGPEALHVAAYELREFMNSLPRVLDLPFVPHVQVLNKVHTLVAQWRKKSSASACLKDGKWTGEIDKHLSRLLKVGGDFIDWVEKQVPTRRAEASTVLKRLLPTTPHANPAA
jgi:hypothetical protein